MTLIKNLRPAVAIGVPSILLAILTVGLLVLASDDAGVSLPLELAKGFMALLSALAITAGVSYLLTRRTQGRTEAIARINSLSTLLQELKSAYEKMAVSRTMLRASRSGRTFEKQFPEILESRARLQRMERDDIFNEIDLSEVRESISKMVEFTRGATVFYVENYPELVRSSLVEEHVREQVRRGDNAPLLDLPMLDLDTLKEVGFLRILTSEKCIWRRSDFYLAYDAAKVGIEAEIKAARIQIS